MISRGRIVLVWISNKYMLADPTTKNLLADATTYVLFCLIAEVKVTP